MREAKDPPLSAESIWPSGDSIGDEALQGFRADLSSMAREVASAPIVRNRLVRIEILEFTNSM